MAFSINLNSVKFLQLLASHEEFPRSMQKPNSDSRHLYAGGRLGSKQVAPKLILDQT